MLRQPIVATLGHVDHGKTSLLDSIRNTKVQSREAGAITQAIGASEVPAGIINELCSDLLAKMGIKLSIPGLLFIDTPGHEAFTNLRKRGGSIADIAILVIDVTKGIEPQTVEAIEILREYKTPFIIALNKVDAISGWKKLEGKSFAENEKQQMQHTLNMLDEKTYVLIGKLYEFGFQAERFDRISDFTKQITIVPVSAREKIGLQELLLFISGLAQKFLEQHLRVQAGSGKGSVMEIREEKGLGRTLDVILYEGSISAGDEIIFGSTGGPVESVVKALLKPKPLDEMRDPRQKFSSIKEVRAASGVKIACDNTENAVAGSSLFVVKNAEEKQTALSAIKQELSELLFEASEEGVLLNADALGSIEAITKLFKHNGIPVHKTSIGPPSHAEIMQATAMRETNKEWGVVFAFNVEASEETKREAEEGNVKIFEEKIIYNLIDGYKRWVTEEREKEKRTAFEKTILPAKVTVLQGCCFRASNPCIVGVEVQAGRIKKEYPLMNSEGEFVGRIKQIQHDKKAVDEAKKGDQLAISLPEPTFGRQIQDKQVLYSMPQDEEIELIEKKYLQALSEEEKEVLEEIKKIKQSSKEN